MTQGDIDDLFKKGSEQYDFSYRPDAWQQMEEMLDRQRRRRRWLLLLLLFFGLAIGGGLWYFSRPDVPIAPEAAPAVIHQDSQQIVPPTLSPDQVKPSKSTKPTASDDQRMVDTQRAEKLDNRISSTGDAAEISTPAIRQHNPNTNVDSLTTQDGRMERTLRVPPANPKNTEPAIATATEETPPSLPTEVRTNIDLPDSTALSTRLLDDAEPTMAYQQQLLPFAQIRTLRLYPVSMDPASDLPPLDKELAAIDLPLPDPIVSRAWAIGVMTSADWNSVGFLDEPSFGWKEGLLVEHRLGKRWSLRLGLAYSQKNYVAGPGEYHAKAEFWDTTNHLYPISTDAKCRILQIPLLLQYYANGFANRGFFASAGLTSFFMSREQFTFNYAETPTPEAPLEWEERWTNQHIFGVGQLHIGYQGTINKHVLWQISPYAQLPLTEGIGHGKVALYSVGLEANLKLLLK